MILRPVTSLKEAPKEEKNRQYIIYNKKPSEIGGLFLEYPKSNIYTR
jgi:hypothetical protein